MSSSVHFDNKEKDILIHSGRPTQGLLLGHEQQKQNVALLLHNQEKDLY